MSVHPEAPAAAIARRVSALTVLSVGQVTHDRYGDSIVPGGCAYFGARAAAALGARSWLLTAVGEDFTCNDALLPLATHTVTGGATTVFTNSYPEGGLRVQHVETQAPSLHPPHLPPAFVKPDLLFLAPVMGEIDPRDPWQTTVDARLTTLSLQGFLKKGEDKQGRRVVVRDPSPLPDALFSGVDALFFSEEDLALFGSPELLERLRGLVPLVFVTAGEAGCTIYHGHHRLAAGIYSTDRVVDPTGAGDTFAMGTSVGLAAGLDAVQAALLGAAAASIVVEARGSEEISRVLEAWGRFDTLLQSL